MSTASASAARSTIRKIWMLRRENCPPAAKPSIQRGTSSRVSRSSGMPPRPVRMCLAAHSYCWRLLFDTSSLAGAHSSTSRPTVSAVAAHLARRGERASPRSRRAARCDGYVPSWRGRSLPVSVSMPSTRTTHLSRCCRTVGRPVGFHAMATLDSDTSLIHRAENARGPRRSGGTLGLYQTSSDRHFELVRPERFELPTF